MNRLNRCIVVLSLLVLLVAGCRGQDTGATTPAVWDQSDWNQSTWQ